MPLAIIHGTVVAGHGVASGRAADARFPLGTLDLQWPIFEAAGVDLAGLFKGTINLSVAPLKPRPVRALHTFRKVKWHEHCPAEDFSFFEMRIAVDGGAAPVGGYIYRPHPETKPEHFQDPHVIELLAPRLQGIAAGATVRLWVDPAQMAFAE